jgi:hypothetical protein
VLSEDGIQETVHLQIHLSSVMIILPIWHTEPNADTNAYPSPSSLVVVDVDSGDESPRCHSLLVCLHPAASCAWTDENCQSFQTHVQDQSHLSQVRISIVRIVESTHLLHHLRPVGLLRRDSASEQEAHQPHVGMTWLAIVSMIS